jgi:hypothetical protein
VPRVCCVSSSSDKLSLSFSLSLTLPLSPLHICFTSELLCAKGLWRASLCETSLCATSLCERACDACLSLMSDYPSICLPARLPVCLSVCLSIRQHHGRGMCHLVLGPYVHTICPYIHTMYIYVCMHVCVCVCMCVCMYVCMYVCIYTYIYRARLSTHSCFLPLPLPVPSSPLPLPSPHPLFPFPPPSRALPHVTTKETLHDVGGLLPVLLQVVLARLCTTNLSITLSTKTTFLLYLSITFSTNTTYLQKSER